jgi:hypothetical protein
MRVYRCKKCGWICRAEMKSDIGTAHGHAEKHVGLWKFPAWLFPSANPEKLDEVIEELSVKVENVNQDITMIREMNKK